MTRYLWARKVQRDPDTLIPTELDKDARDIEAIRGAFPNTEDIPPIVTAGDLIVDGHHRWTVAKERGDMINTVEIDQDVFDELTGLQFDPIEIAYAALTEAGEDEQAAALVRQFPGAGVDDAGFAILDWLETGGGRFRNPTRSNPPLSREEQDRVNMVLRGGTKENLNIVALQVRARNWEDEEQGIIRTAVANEPADFFSVEAMEEVPATLTRRITGDETATRLRGHVLIDRDTFDEALQAAHEIGEEFGLPVMEPFQEDLVRRLRRIKGDTTSDVPLGHRRRRQRPPGPPVSNRDDIDLGPLFGRRNPPLSREEQDRVNFILIDERNTPLWLEIRDMPPDQRARGRYRLDVVKALGGDVNRVVNAHLIYRDDLEELKHDARVMAEEFGLGPLAFGGKPIVTRTGPGVPHPLRHTGDRGDDIGTIFGRRNPMTLANRFLRNPFRRSRSNPMELFCTNCAEPFEALEVMDDPELKRQVLSGRCPVCRGRPQRGGRPFKAQAMEALADLAGDDLDGLAADLDDFESMGLLNPGRSTGYRWEITSFNKDLFDRDDFPNPKGNVLVEGPRGLDKTIKSNATQFRILDDDGIWYFTGTLYGEFTGFEPLKDFGEPWAGATEIQLKEGRGGFNALNPKSSRHRALRQRSASGKGRRKAKTTGKSAKKRQKSHRSNPTVSLEKRNPGKKRRGTRASASKPPKVERTCRCCGKELNLLEASDDARIHTRCIRRHVAHRDGRNASRCREFGSKARSNPGGNAVARKASNPKSKSRKKNPGSGLPKHAATQGDGKPMPGDGEERTADEVFDANAPEEKREETEEKVANPGNPKKPSKRAGGKKRNRNPEGGLSCPNCGAQITNNPDVGTYPCPSCSASLEVYE